MTTYERRQTILDLLHTRPGLRVTEIASALDVSSGTVRNDLNALESEGLLTRFHGGAVLTGRKTFLSTSFRTRYSSHVFEKQAIARSAASLVEDDDSVLMDASSTIYYLALALKPRQHLRVVTNGLDVARLLAQDPTNSVILIGGILSQDGSSVTGLLSEGIIQDLHIQKAFVSASGFSVDRGLTEVHLAEAQLKRKAIASAQQLFALLDSSKLGQEDLTSFASPEQISCLYTDAAISPQWQAQIAQAGIALNICI